MLTWKKGDTLKYSKHFSLQEFSCHCTRQTCVSQTISPSLLQKLENVRTAYGRPIQVTSGYRCKEHQAALAAAGMETATHSQHCFGMAADIKGEDMDALDVACSQEFMAIGRAKSFIHVDLRDDKRRRWGYVKS